MDNNSIRDKIKSDIDRMKLIRVSRIKAAKRLEKYDNKWKIILLIYNIIAVCSVFESFNNKLSPTVSGIISMGVILIQDFVATRDYKNRASNLHYQQLNIKQIILKLDTLLLDKSIDNQELIDKYNSISNEYCAILFGYENHDDFDFLNAKRELYNKNYCGEPTNKRDFSWENIFTNIQFIFIIVSIIIIFKS